MSFFIENNNDVLVVSFGSMGRAPANPDDPNIDLNDSKYFDFFRFLPDNFKNIDIHYYWDPDQYCYHKGIRGLSTDIDSTVKYLRERIGDRYKKVIFMGLSGGGYAAILFGSLLNINHVVAFYPSTQLIENRPDYEIKYKDLLPYINKTTKYHLLAVTKSRFKCHDLRQCQRLCISKNVTLQAYNVVDDMKDLMKECKLHIFLENIINSPEK
jgi:hypothetical protein